MSRSWPRCLREQAGPAEGAGRGNQPDRVKAGAGIGHTTAGDGGQMVRNPAAREPPARRRPRRPHTVIATVFGKCCASIIFRARPRFADSASGVTGGSGRPGAAPAVTANQPDRVRARVRASSNVTNGIFRINQPDEQPREDSYSADDGGGHLRPSGGGRRTKPQQKPANEIAPFRRQAAHATPGRPAKRRTAEASN